MHAVRDFGILVVLGNLFEQAFRAFNGTFEAKPSTRPEVPSSWDDEPPLAAIQDGSVEDHRDAGLAHDTSVSASGAERASAHQATDPELVMSVPTLSTDRRIRKAEA